MPRPLNRTERRLAAGLCAAAMMAAASYAILQAAMQPAPLETLIPESAIVYASADARWLWDATEGVRAARAVTEGIGEFERQAGISLEGSVIPWAGRVAVAALATDKAPHTAFFIEVRHPVQYYMTMTRIRTQVERETSHRWTGTGYEGVPLRYSYIGRGADRVPVSTAWLKGWLVVGVGNGTTKRVIDTWQNRKRSLADNAAWAAVLSRMPQDAPLSIGTNSRAAAEMSGRVDAWLLDLQSAVTAAGVTEIEDGFRLVASTNATRPASRRLYADLAALPGADPAVFDHLPDGTFFSATLSEPAGWWKALEPVFERGYRAEVSRMGAGGAREASAFLDATKARLEPARLILSRFPGGMGVGVAFREDQGFGLTIAGQAASEASARAAADELAEYVERFDEPVEQGDDGVYRASGMSAKPDFALEPAWKAEGRYLLGATQTQWLATNGNGAGGAAFPPEASGAQVLERGNFGFVEPLLRKYGPEQPSTGQISKEDVIRIWRATGLGDARWWSYGTLRANGMQDSVAELHNWDWRAALQNLIQMAEDRQTSQR